MPGVDDLDAAVRQALANPVGSPGLSKLAQPGSKVVIVVDDITRPVPSTELLVPIVDELNDAGISDDDITVLVALGLHRKMTTEELNDVLGPLAGRINIVNHDPNENLEHLGITKLGTDIHINKTFLDADLKILTGDVEVHQFCGYGGGAKSIHPGLADSNSVCLTHSRMEAEGAGPGRIDGNPIREDIDEVGRMTGADFVVNVVLNPYKEAVGVFCGDVEKAFREGTKVCDDIYKVEVPERADVVLASAGGYPKDIELYQAQKAVQSAVRMVKKGGKIILLAECREGHGSDLAYQWAREADTPDVICARIKEKFVMGGHKAYQLALAAKWADVYLLSNLEDEVVKEFFFTPVSDAAEVKNLIEADDKVAVLPQASLTLASISGEPEQPGFGLPVLPE
jgi:nickel-dependent lactate racemase